MTAFDPAIVSAVLSHMNGDHSADNLLIANAFLPAGTPTSSVMTGIDADAGTWTVTLADGGSTELRVPWPAGSISERAEIRREIVALHTAAAQRLGLDQSQHGG